MPLATDMSITCSSFPAVRVTVCMVFSLVGPTPNYLFLPVIALNVNSDWFILMAYCGDFILYSSIEDLNLTLFSHIGSDRNASVQQASMLCTLCTITSSWSFKNPFNHHLLMQNSITSSLRSSFIVSTTSTNALGDNGVRFDAKYMVDLHIISCQSVVSGCFLPHWSTEICMSVLHWGWRSDTFAAHWLFLWCNFVFGIFCSFLSL